MENLHVILSGIEEERPQESWGYLPMHTLTLVIETNSPNYLDRKKVHRLIVMKVEEFIEEINSGEVQL